MTTFRYKYKLAGDVHKVEKRKNGTPWVRTVCGYSITNDLYTPTRDAANCEDCINPTEQGFCIDPAWVNADPDEAFVIGAI